MHQAIRRRPLHSQGRDREQDPHSVQQEVFLLLEIPLSLVRRILPRSRRLASLKGLQHSGLLHSGLLPLDNLLYPSLISAPLPRTAEVFLPLRGPGHRRSQLLQITLMRPQGPFLGSLRLVAPVVRNSPNQPLVTLHQQARLSGDPVLSVRQPDPYLVNPLPLVSLLVQPPPSGNPLPLQHLARHPRHPRIR